VQELMTNVIKHAHATKALCEITISPNKINILVADNGQGITTARIQKNGIGLTSTRSKVNLLNGKMDVRSDNSGTSVEIMIPIPEIK
jgi:signal transduction histidine kinase